MKSFIAVLCALLLAQVSAFAPALFGVRPDSALAAKHVRDKAAKWAASKRPKKSRPSDINRTPVIYELTSVIKPAEYTISDAAAVLAVKPE
mmetsp:Transcript_4682/g.6083  ORF Transcript_4682/g.6083 Transcript_4682/m.6083 type:complete len:91 (+) Transcript_4682:144-416(+)|eukprot:CAMPEP_0198143122 /NCGR_PEP_ID=MMETSP1443-20131203/5816_1 /TAXON_ID=186043 /ORGANISM="Entomoneis sp., Strain CCMP2396" /LENGTH=90 /DNA_ID=CAMNT_0043806273 /DNA_START=90 /DNA_END=362 /DNA_ORIENTATION=-